MTTPTFPVTQKWVGPVVPGQIALAADGRIGLRQRRLNGAVGPVTVPVLVR